MEKSLDFEMRIAYVAHRTIAVRGANDDDGESSRSSLPTLDAIILSRQ